MRILLVEDNDDHRELMCRALTEHDLTWQVAGAVSGDEALRHLAEGETYDLVILDYSLPGRDGLELLKEIRRGKAPASVVMVTGRGDERVAVEAMKGGAYDYVVKSKGYLLRLPVVAQRAMEVRKLAVDRKRAEEALRESEEKYRNLVERANDGIIIVQDGIVKYINARLAEMRGVTVEEVIDTPFTDQIYPDELPEVVDRYKQRMAGEDVLPIYETALRGRDGSKIHAELNAGIVTYQGKPADLVIIRDITDRKRAEEALRESQKRFQALTETTSDFVWEMDVNGVYTYCSPQINELWGYKPEDMIGRTPFDLMIPEDREHAINMFRKISESPSSFKGMETSSRDNTGRIVVLETSGVPFFDIDGRLCGYRGISRDITERKRAENELRKSEAKLKEAQALGRIGSWEFDLDSRTVQWSDQVYRLYERDPSIGPPNVEEEEAYYSQQQADRLHEYARIVVEQGRAFEYDLEARLPSGRVAHFAATMRPIKDESGRIVRLFGTVQDITERKRAEEEVHRKAKELQEKNDELTRFTYAVAHDLRSPLVTIQTFRGHLERDIRSRDAARVEKDLGYIRNAADKMGRLLDDLRRFSRVGRIINPSEEAPLQAIVKEALDLVAGRITGRGVRIDLTEEPVVLYGDRTRLVEVFLNLVDNAVKFMGDQPAPRVEIGVEEAGEELVLHVRDNGIGIDPELQPLVFGLFHKLDPGSEGEGIGLALSKRIVELHGGRIRVESEGLGKGTTFRFTLAKTKRGVGREERT